MIGSLMYVTSSRPDIMFATCMCTRYQANPNEHHVSAVKRIFRYLKGTINLGLWYPKDSGFDLTTYSDADHVGYHLDKKSASCSVQFLGDKLMCWSSKKQNCVSISTAESEYVAVSSCCAQVLWMRTQLTDYGFFYDKVPIYCDSKSAIAISCNPVQHTRTKHIDVRTGIDLPRSLPSYLGKLGLGSRKQIHESILSSLTTHLKNEIYRFTQRFKETFGEAWERFKEILRACLHHEFMELAQIDTFYNGLNDNDQDSLNAATGGNLLSKTTREALENASKSDDRIDKFADKISTLVDIFAKKVVTSLRLKRLRNLVLLVVELMLIIIVQILIAINQVFVWRRGQGNNFNRGNNFQPFQVPNQGFQNQPFQVQQGFSNKFSNYKKVNDQMMRNMQNQINSLKGEFKNEIQNTVKTQQTVLMEQQNAFQNNLQNMFSGFFQNQSSTSGTLSSNTIPNPKGEMKAITTRSGIAYEGPSIPTPKKVVERETKETTDKEQSNFQGSTAHIRPPVTLILEPDVLKTLPKPNLPYPSFADALILMLKFALTIKSLLTNKDKLFELAKIPLNENCSAMLLKKLPEKLRGPGKFLIPCDFPGMDVCHALADLDASINLMPLSIYKKFSLPELTPTRMTLELADRSITRPKGVTENVFVKVGKFQFPTDFVVVNFEADPRVPLILGRSFLSTVRALIDVYKEEITLWVNDKAVTFNLNLTTRYSSTYDDLFVNRIDIIDVAREEYAQEILGFTSNSSGGNLTLTFEPIISDSSPSLTSFEGSDFLLEEIDDCLKDESVSLEIDHADCDPEGDICLIENLLNNDPFQLPPMDLKQREVVKAKSSIEEPPKLELKELPSYLEYAYLEGVDELPVIIAKDLKVDEKEALLKVLKSHKRAIAWKITDIKGIDPRFCTDKILMEEDFKPTVKSQNGLT
nr:reverse transcriptase domain-containing protein [Tanacetum cinerariifolium]